MLKDKFQKNKCKSLNQREYTEKLESYSKIILTDKPSYNHTYQDENLMKEL